MSDVVIVTGSRAWPTDAYSVVWRALAAERPELVVHGACPLGPDEMAERWCKRMQVDYRGMPAHWERDGVKDRGAGFKRNVRMLERYPGELVLGFPFGDARGTRHCIANALRLGHPVKVFDVTGLEVTP